MFCGVPTYPLGTCNCTWVVVVMEDAVSSHDGVDRPTHSFIEAITLIHPSTRKGRWAHSGRGAGRGGEGRSASRRAVERRSAPRYMKNAHTASTNSPSHTNVSKIDRLTDRQTQPRGSTHEELKATRVLQLSCCPRARRPPAIANHMGGRRGMLERGGR